MRTELVHIAPSGELDRIAEGLRGEYRAQQIPLDAQAKPRRIDIVDEGGGLHPAEAALAGAP